MYVIWLFATLLWDVLMRNVVFKNKINFVIWVSCYVLCCWSRTPCSKKVSHLMFNNNFGRRGPISKILSPLVRKLSMHTSQRFPPHLKYVATLPCESRKSKNVTNFSRWTWQLICLTKILSEILCNLSQKYCTNDFT